MLTVVIQGDGCDAAVKNEVGASCGGSSLELIS